MGSSTLWSLKFKPNTRVKWPWNIFVGKTFESNKWLSRDQSSAAYNCHTESKIRKTLQKGLNILNTGVVFYYTNFRIWVKVWSNGVLLIVPYVDQLTENFKGLNDGFIYSSTSLWESRRPGFTCIYFLHFVQWLIYLITSNEGLKYRFLISLNIKTSG